MLPSSSAMRLTASESSPLTTLEISFFISALGSFVCLGLSTSVFFCRCSGPCPLRVKDFFAENHPHGSARSKPWVRSLWRANLVELKRFPHGFETEFRQWQCAEISSEKDAKLASFSLSISDLAINFRFLLYYSAPYYIF